MHSMFFLYQIFILNGFFIVFYEWYNHATNITCRPKRLESRLRKVSLPSASAAIYKCGDFRKNTVALLAEHCSLCSHGGAFVAENANQPDGENISFYISPPPRSLPLIKKNLHYVYQGIRSLVNKLMLPARMIGSL